MRYGHQRTPRGFSWQLGIDCFVSRSSRHQVSGLTAAWICLRDLPTPLDPHFHPWASLPSCVTPSVFIVPGSTGVLTRFPSATPFGLALGPTNPERIDLAQETLGFRRTRFSRVFSLLVPAGSLPCPQLVLVGRASAEHGMLLYQLERPKSLQVRSFGNRLEPR